MMAEPVFVPKKDAIIHQAMTNFGLLLKRNSTRQISNVHQMKHLWLIAIDALARMMEKMEFARSKDVLAFNFILKLRHNYKKPINS